jgi:hypothetical protein
MRGLGLEDKRNQMALKQKELDDRASFNRDVVGKAKTPEEFEQMTRQFIAVNPQANVSAIAQDGARLFDITSESQRKAYDLASAKRRDALESQFFDQTKELQQSKIEYEKLKTGQEMSSLRMKENETIIQQQDKVVSALSSLPVEQFSDQDKAKINAMANYYNNNIANKSIEDQQVFSAQMERTLAPVLVATNTYSILANRYAEKHLESRSKIMQDYQSDFSEWQKGLGENEPKTFDDYILARSKEANTPGTKGYDMAKNHASLMKDASSLRELRDGFKAYNSSLATAINSQGEFDPSKQTQVQIAGAQLSNVAARLITSEERELKVKEQQLEIRQKELNLENTKVKADVGRATIQEKEASALNRGNLLLIKNKQAQLLQEMRNLASYNNQLSKKQGVDKEAVEANADATNKRIEKLNGELDNLLSNTSYEEEISPVE